MKNKLNIVPKDKKCRCGRKITHHHFHCNDCWEEDKNTSKLKKKAMKKTLRGLGG